MSFREFHLSAETTTVLTSRPSRVLLPQRLAETLLLDPMPAERD